MSSDTLTIGAFGVGLETILYQMANGALANAVVVPVVGYGMIKIGECCKSDTISTIGSSVILASILAFPGSTVSYAIYALGGKTLTATTIAWIVGSGVTYKVSHFVLDFIAKDVARTVASAR